MSQIKITPALLAEWKEKAWSYVEWENLKGENEHPRYFSDKASFEQIATPDVVLALVDEIKRLNERFDEQKLLATRMIEHAAVQKKEIERLNRQLFIKEEALAAIAEIEKIRAERQQSKGDKE
jgi:hypothetical protein